MARRKGSTVKAKAKETPKPVEEDVDTVHARLCNEYPEVDSTLIFAMLLELENRSQESLDDLCRNLEQLAVDAKSLEDPSATYRSQLNTNSTNFEGTDEPDTSCFSDSIFPENTPTESSSPSSDLNSAPGMEFLLAVFPQTSPATLQRALEEFEDEETGDVDMEKVVEEVMSLELVRELEERGLDEDDAERRVDDERKRDWSLYENKKASKRKKAKSVATIKPSTPASAATIQASKTFVLSDVRQQANRQHSSKPGIVTQNLVNDPWTKVASLSARLEQLLPPLTSSHFSILHKSTSTSASTAIRQELARIGGQDKDPPPERFDAVLATFLELLHYQDEGDAALCLRATKLDVANALDLVDLLRDLDSTEPMFVRSPVATHSPSPISTQASDLTKAMITPLPKSPIPTATYSRSLTTSSWSTPPQQQNDEWTPVTHVRKRNANKPAFEEDPLAAFIPAYANRPAGWRSAGGRAAWEPELSEEKDERECREMAAYYRKRREETLREATRYWKGNGGGMRNGVNVGRGGEVALFYAEESREFERRSREWSLKAAKAMVASRQANSKDLNAIDLHGTNTQEALSIARQAIQEWWSTYGNADGRPATKNFSIITGRGNHSKGGVGVIGPAVRNWLEADGWRFVQRPGTFVVTGVSRRARG